MSKTTLTFTAGLLTLGLTAATWTRDGGAFIDPNGRSPQAERDGGAFIDPNGRSPRNEQDGGAFIDPNG